MTDNYVEVRDGRGEFDSDIDLGPCCACGEARPLVRNICLLDYEAPIPGTGWGCFQCGLPMDGAVAVICDECVDANAEPRFVVVGQPAEQKRMLIDELEKRPFQHRLEFHPDVFELRRCRLCGCTDEDGCPGGCCWIGEDLCSRCEGVRDDEMRADGWEDDEPV